MTPVSHQKEELTLVTGASGFIGRSLCEQMRTHGMATRGVSRTPSTGMTKIDTYGPEQDWGPVLEGVTTIIHLAGRAHVMNENAIEALSLFREANLAATERLANAAVNAGVRRFVFVSSVKVHGEYTERGRPFKADDPLDPAGPYAVSKADAEVALRKLEERSGMEVVIVRPPLVHGPGEKGNMLRLRKWADLGLPSPFGNIHNLRSRVHVRNLCDFLMIAAKHPDANGHSFLVSDGVDVSTQKMLEEAYAATGKHVKNIRIPPQIWEVMRKIPKTRDLYLKLFADLTVDIEQTRIRLGYAPTLPPAVYP